MTRLVSVARSLRNAYACTTTNANGKIDLRSLLVQQQTQSIRIQTSTSAFYPRFAFSTTSNKSQTETESSAAIDSHVPSTSSPADGKESISSSSENATNPTSASNTSATSTSSSTSSSTGDQSSSSSSDGKEHPKRTRGGVIYDVVLGIVTGYALYQLYDFVFYFPDPLPLIFEIANKDSTVEEMVGTPVRMNYLGTTWTGSITDDVVDVKIPIRGSKDTGVFYSRAMKLNGEWKFLYIQVRDSKLPQRISVYIPGNFALYNQADPTPENDAGAFTHL